MRITRLETVVLNSVSASLKFREGAAILFIDFQADFVVAFDRLANGDGVTIWRDYSLCIDERWIVTPQTLFEKEFGGVENCENRPLVCGLVVVVEEMLYAFPKGIDRVVEDRAALFGHDEYVQQCYTVVRGPSAPCLRGSRDGAAEARRRCDAWRDSAPETVLSRVRDGKRGDESEHSGHMRRGWPALRTVRAGSVRSYKILAFPWRNPEELEVPCPASAQRHTS